MTLKYYLWLMTFGAIICWVAWGFVLFNINPEEATALSFVFFYVSLFFSLLGSFSVLIFLFKKKNSPSDEAIFHQVKRTFRQSILFALFIIICLLLLQAGLLRWWSFCLLCFLLFLVEGLIFANRKFHNNNYV